MSAWPRWAVNNHREFMCLRESSDGAKLFISATAIQLTPKLYYRVCSRSVCLLVRIVSCRSSAEPIEMRTRLPRRRCGRAACRRPRWAGGRGWCSSSSPAPAGSTAPSSPRGTVDRRPRARWCWTWTAPTARSTHQRPGGGRRRRRGWRRTDRRRSRCRRAGRPARPRRPSSDWTGRRRSGLPRAPVVIRNESVPKITTNDTINFFKLQSAFWKFYTVTVSECCLIKLPHIFYLKNMFIFQDWKWLVQGTITVPIVSAHIRFLYQQRLDPSLRKETESHHAPSNQ